MNNNYNFASIFCLILVFLSIVHAWIPDTTISAMSCSEYSQPAVAGDGCWSSMSEFGGGCIVRYRVCRDSRGIVISSQRISCWCP